MTVAAIPSSDWQKKRERRLLMISASQIETFRLCARKWWLDSVRRLPVPVVSGGPFGTCLHGVCGRFEMADDLGRGADGVPIDLYPQGWHIARDRHTGQVEGEITLIEQGTVKQLVSTAIESGILDRPPGRQIEKPINFTVLKAVPESNLDTTVQMVGYIDLALPTEIRDHKTTKNMRYAKSPAALAKNAQMLIYAYATIREWTEHPDQMPFVLRHNVFCKDPSALVVRRVEAAVTVGQILGHWDTVVDDASKMVQYRDRINVWHELPDPSTEACNAYGGCPFRSICNGQESEQGYENRISRCVQLAGQQRTCFSSQETRMSMNFAEKLAQKKQVNAAVGNNGNGHAVAQSPQPAPQPMPVQQPAPQPMPVQQVQQQPLPAPPAPVPAPPPPPSLAQLITNNPVQITAPPWAKQGCTACGGLGFNSKGSPCRICETTAANEGRATSMAFVLEALGDGRVAWQSRQNPAFFGVSYLTPPTAPAQPPVQTQERVAMAPPPVVQQPPQAPATAPSVVQQSAPDSAASTAPAASVDDEAKGRGRPKKGFILCVNCAPVRGQGRTGSGRAVHYLPDVLRRIGEQMAKDVGVESYYDIDAFKRRDLLCKYIDAIAEQFGADMVVALDVGTGQSDLKAMVDALRGIAGMEIVGTSV